MSKHWTENEPGHANSSELYVFLSRKVEQIIRDDAHYLINGNVEGVARRIVSSLAHVYHMEPTDKSYNECQIVNPKIYSERFLNEHKIIVMWQGVQCLMDCLGSYDYDHRTGYSMYFKCNRCSRVLIVNAQTNEVTKDQSSEQQS